MGLEMSKNTKNLVYYADVQIIFKSGGSVNGRLLEMICSDQWIIIENIMGNLQLIALSDISRFEILTPLTNEQLKELGLKIKE